MKPVRNYHEQTFSNDLNMFFESLGLGPRQINGGDGVVRDPRTSFHVEDLKLSDTRDHLVHIKTNDLPYFAASLTYVVLTNQIIHYHFSEKHEEFWGLTRYPLVAGGMNPTTSPYRILDDGGWVERGVEQVALLDSWRDLFDCFEEDIQEFLTGPGENLGIIWGEFKEAVVKDLDIVSPEPWGQVVENSIL